MSGQAKSRSAKWLSEPINSAGNEGALWTLEGDSAAEDVLSVWNRVEAILDGQPGTVTVTAPPTNAATPKKQPRTASGGQIPVVAAGSKQPMAVPSAWKTPSRGTTPLTTTAASSSAATIPPSVVATAYAPVEEPRESIQDRIAQREQLDAAARGLPAIVAAPAVSSGWGERGRADIAQLESVASWATVEANVETTADLNFVPNNLTFEVRNQAPPQVAEDRVPGFMFQTPAASPTKRSSSPTRKPASPVKRTPSAVKQIPSPVKKAPLPKKVSAPTTQQAASSAPASVARNQSPAPRSQSPSRPTQTTTIINSRASPTKPTPGRVSPTKPTAPSRTASPKLAPLPPPKSEPNTRLPRQSMSQSALPVISTSPSNKSPTKIPRGIGVALPALSRPAAKPEASTDEAGDAEPYIGLPVKDRIKMLERLEGSKNRIQEKLMRVKSESKLPQLIRSQTEPKLPALPEKEKGEKRGFMAQAQEAASGIKRALWPWGSKEAFEAETVGVPEPVPIPVVEEQPLVPRGLPFSVMASLDRDGNRSDEVLSIDSTSTDSLQSDGPADHSAPQITAIPEAVSAQVIEQPAAVPVSNRPGSGSSALSTLSGDTACEKREDFKHLSDESLPPKWDSANKIDFYRNSREEVVALSPLVDKSERGVVEVQGYSSAEEDEGAVYIEEASDLPPVTIRGKGKRPARDLPKTPRTPLATAQLPLPLAARVEETTAKVVGTSVQEKPPTPPPKSPFKPLDEEKISPDLPPLPTLVDGTATKLFESPVASTTPVPFTPVAPPKPPVMIKAASAAALPYFTPDRASPAKTPLLSSTSKSPSFLFGSLPRSHSLIMDTSTPSKLQMAIEALRQKVDLAAEDARLAEERSHLRKKSIDALATVESAAAAVGRAAAKERERAARSSRQRETPESRSRKLEREQDEVPASRSSSVDYIREDLNRIMEEAEQEAKRFEAALNASRLVRRSSSELAEVSANPAPVTVRPVSMVAADWNEVAAAVVDNSKAPLAPQTPLSKFADTIAFVVGHKGIGSTASLESSPGFARKSVTGSMEVLCSPAKEAQDDEGDEDINRLNSMVSKLVAQATKVLSSKELDAEAAIAVEEAVLEDKKEQATTSTRSRRSSLGSVVSQNFPVEALENDTSGSKATSRTVSRAVSFASLDSLAEEETEWPEQTVHFQPIMSVETASTATNPASTSPTDVIRRNSPTTVFNGRTMPSILFALRSIVPPGTPSNILLHVVVPAALFVIQLYIAVCATVLNETEGALHRIQKSLSERSMGGGSDNRRKDKHRD